MNLQRVNQEKANEYSVQMLSRKYSLYSNYFGHSFSANDFYIETEHTFLLKKPVLDDNFSRIYLVTDDEEDTIQILRSLKGINVLNVPTKGDIEPWNKLMFKSGYKQIGIYDRHYYLIPKVTLGIDDDMSNILFATKTQVDEIYHLYRGWKDFSVYTDYSPTLNELKTFIKNNEIIINIKNDKITGVFIFSIMDKKIDLRLIIDTNGSGGKLLHDMFIIARRKEIAIATGFVNTKNTLAKKFYLIMGGKFDGLKDYTWIKT
jgi:hypothetical protein